MNFVISYSFASMLLVVFALYAQDATNAVQQDSTNKSSPPATLEPTSPEQKIDVLVSKCSTLFRKSGLQTKIWSDADGDYVLTPSFEQIFGKTDLTVIKPMIGRGGETDLFARAFLNANIEFQVMKEITEPDRIPDQMRKCLGIFYTLDQNGKFISLLEKRELPLVSERDVRAFNRTKEFWQAFRELTIAETRFARTHDGWPHFFAKELSQAYPGNKAKLLEDYRMVKRVWLERGFLKRMRQTDNQ